MLNTIVIGTPVLLTGGTEVQTLVLVRVLIHMGNRVVVCCYHEHDDKMVAAYQQAGAEVSLLSLPRARTPFAMINLVRTLRRSFRALRPDIIHLQYLEPGLLAALAAFLSDSRVMLLSIHHPFSGKPARHRWFFRFAAALSDQVIANSLATESSWFGSSQLFDSNARMAERKHWTIYNCVDYHHVREIVASSNPNSVSEQPDLSGRYVLVVLGRLSPEKGHAVLINALAIVKSRIPNVLLLVVGSGPIEHILRVQATNLGLEGNIRWCGTVSHDGAIRQLASAQCVVVPSLLEGFGLAAAEAMAAGTLVIASSVGGLPEVLDNGTAGILVEPGSAPALAEAILSSPNDPAKRQQMKETALLRVQRMFSPESYGSRMEAFYRKISRIHEGQS